MLVKPYPHININVEDRSIFTPIDVQTLPLFRPLFITTAQKGPLNTPVWCPSLSYAERYFGAETFDPNSTYYTREAATLRLIFENSGAFIARIAPTAVAAGVVTEASVAAARVLECSVSEKEIPQYETDADGARVVSGGDYIEIADGEISGLELVWSLRELGADEDVTDITADSTSTFTDGAGDEWTTYPMAVFYAPNPGAWGDRAGFSLYYDANQNSAGQYDRLGTPMYSFAPVLKDEDGVVGVVRDYFSNVLNHFVMKENVTDPATDAPVSMADVLDVAYPGTELPYSIVVFHENFDTIGDLLIAKETAEGKVPWQYDDGAEYTADWDDEGTELTVEEAITDVEEGMGVTGTGIPDGAVVVSKEGQVVTISLAATAAGDGATITIDTPINSQFEFADGVDGWGINIISGIDPENNIHYQRLIVTSDNDTMEAGLQGEDATEVVVSLIADNNYYLANGDDGTFADGGNEAYISNFLDGTLANIDGTYADLTDASRYPFNYLFDVGYALDTKQDLIAFTSVRDDVRASVGSYIPGETNNQLTNIATGLSLRNYAILQLESVAKGTEGCRTSVWVQSGQLVGDASGLWYPTTLWDAYVHALYQNRQSLNEVPEGLPNSAITLFKEWNWVPSSEDVKSLLWDSGLNYTQYYNMTGLHFPAIRTVYNEDTSVLTNNVFVDAVTYAKQAMRALHHQYSGMSVPFTTLASAITADMETAVQQIFNGKYEFEVTVYQTDEDRNLGFSLHIDLAVTAPGTNRVWNVNIITQRENFEG